MVQVPAVMGVRVGPETVQIRGVSERNATISPDVADAESVTASPTFACGAVARAFLPAAWPAWTGNDCGMSRAATKRSSPVWEAVTAQVPAAIAVTVTPETEHTEGVSERNDTTSPEVADAARVTGLPT